MKECKDCCKEVDIMPGDVVTISAGAGEFYLACGTLGEIHFYGLESGNRWTDQSLSQVLREDGVEKVNVCYKQIEN